MSAAAQAPPRFPPVGPTEAPVDASLGSVPSAAPQEPAAPSPAAEVVLEVRDLRTFFFTYEGVVKALDGVSFQLRRGETTGLVGETGCGKSVTALSITRLVADPPGRIFHGQVLLRGADLLRGLETEAKYKPVRRSLRVRVRRRFYRIRRANARMEAVRGRHIAMIFQEPSQALNPVFSIANQVSEIVLLHHGAEVIDAMLAATPDAPGVAPAVAKLLELPEAEATEAHRRATAELAEAAHSPSLGTEAYYIVRGSGSSANKKRHLEEALARRRLRPLQRRYLRYRRGLLGLTARLHDAYLAELRLPPTPSRGQLPPPGPPAPEKPAGRARGTEFSLKSRLRVAELAHFYYGLPGLLRWVRRPLDDELLWRVVRLLEGVRIANPVQVARGYPHELSGGMIQRVMIAMALSGEPEVLLADEPTTALDVTIQAQILQLLDELRHRVGTAILLITHDLGVIAEVADRVCVMYAGRVVEEGPVREVFRTPLHPYTQGLLGSVPRVDKPEKELRSIQGSVPDLIEPPTGCRFHPRCPQAMPVCQGKTPPWTLEGPEHRVACYLYHGTRVVG